MFDKLIEKMFENILFDELSMISVKGEFLCIGAALLAGLLIMLVYLFTNRRATGSLALTLLVLPAIVQIVIFLVNDNLGMGIAVAGAFSLVRFRSVPGTAREIVALFFATAVGIAFGRGYVWFGISVTVLLAIVFAIVSFIPLGRREAVRRELRITVPESLEFDGMLDDILEAYTSDFTLIRVKTANMGSLYELRYAVTLRDTRAQKRFIDEIRTRNGNLPVTLGILDSDSRL